MRSEFETSSVETTLETMVEEPYVNHVPVIIGGVGLEEVRAFYAERFITQQPPETDITPVSRTIGNDRVVETSRSTPSPTPSRWTGCCRESPRQENVSRSPWPSWSSSGTAR
jgi:hypothetical protein